jgi:SAM domain (Sterile alpha motif)
MGVNFYWPGQKGSRGERSLVAAMQQIADWLKTLGMSEYAQRFAENDIDFSVLRHLTHQDLKELGVSLGHRRKMVAELAGAKPVTASTSGDDGSRTM